MCGKGVCIAYYLCYVCEYKFVRVVPLIVIGAIPFRLFSTIFIFNQSALVPGSVCFGKKDPWKECGFNTELV